MSEIPAAAVEAVLDVLIQECENVEYGDEHEVVCADHGWHLKCAELAVAAAAPLIRQATADEIEAATAHWDETERGRACRKALIATLDRIARRVGGGGGGGGGQ